MKLMKRKDDTSTIRKVWNDDKTVLYGVIGTVEDFLRNGIFEYCDYPPENWCFIAAYPKCKDSFRKTKDEVLQTIKTGN